MKFSLIIFSALYLLIISFNLSISNAGALKVENNNKILNTLTDKNKNEAFKSNLSKNSVKDKNILNSKAKLETIKNAILKNLNEFEKLNKIIIDFENIDSSKNLSLRNFTKEIVLNQTDDFNDTIVINQNFCNLNKLKQNKLKKNQDKIISLEEKNYTKALNSINNSTKNNHTFKIGALKNNKNKTSNNSKDHNHNTNQNNSITSDDLLNLIADQTESIKNEICTNCLEINSALSILIDEIKNIKAQLKKFTEEKLSKKDAYEKLSYCINNINLMKADLFKLNEILDTLQKANCSNFIENSKKYSLVVNSTNKLVEIIQNLLRKLNININLVVLN